ncbi:hypothetical protein FGG08_007198 [Glutinoglossum americanum]|uniref:FAD/NAD(P)-binding domain-containing protein n=1 Tax=Glutinoglossum americanum TaxID=1670608 RepID=A0A9P8L0A6_9PEZI|nr:hypothetical protein FGG08_007198 [Glutinoglossum americanum]
MSSDAESANPALAAAFAVQVQQKYAQEREKRLRADGNEQYIDLSYSDKFKHFRDDPWVDPDAPPAGANVPSGSRYKVLILGAGFGGLLSAVRLIEAGIDVNDIRLVDTAGGFGGTWYWNRFPGLMCDVESYIYMPLLEETGYMPKHRYSYGPELRGYANLIAEKWNLADKALFQTEVRHLGWDDTTKEWVVNLTQMPKGGEEREFEVQSQFVILASGVLNHPKIPKIPGLEEFQGHSFHTSRWDYAYTGGSPTNPSLEKLKDKRVGIIGTGATAIQAIPQLAKWAKHLYVFQRTPSSIDVRDQRPTDEQWWSEEVQGQRGWQRKRNLNFAAQFVDTGPKPEDNLVNDGWSKFDSYSAQVGSPTLVTMETMAQHIAALHALDLPRQERIRARVDAIIDDKAVAAKLKAWYPGWCKRPCFHDDYLIAFNQPNVTLVDTDGRGIDALTPAGVRAAGAEFPLDVLIFSTGFRSPTLGSSAGKANLTVIGRGGQSLEDKWTQGVSTLHGVLSRGFPNLFFPGLSQSGVTANYTFIMDSLARHVAFILAATKAQAATGQRVAVEPSPEAEQAWTMQILARAISFAGMSGCTPNYINRECELDRGSNEEQMRTAQSAPWGDGFASYLDVIEGWRAKGDLEGVVITAV